VKESPIYTAKCPSIRAGLLLLSPDTIKWSSNFVNFRKTFSIYSNPLVLETCPLCGRIIVDPKDANRHHLHPLSRGGKNSEVVRLHRICHVKIHSVFTEKELELKYNSMDALLKTREMEKFVKWLKNKPPGFYDSSQDTNTMQGKRTTRNRRHRK